MATRREKAIEICRLKDLSDDGAVQEDIVIGGRRRVQTSLAQDARIRHRRVADDAADSRRDADKGALRICSRDREPKAVPVNCKGAEG